MGGGGFMPSLTGGASRSGDATSGATQGGDWNVNLGGSGAGSGSGNPGSGISPLFLWIGAGVALWLMFKK